MEDVGFKATLGYKILTSMLLFLKEYELKKQEKLRLCVLPSHHNKLTQLDEKKVGVHKS